MRHIKFKVCMVGGEGVGKTSLIRRYVLQEFSGEYMRTMGAMVSKKTLRLDGDQGATVELMVWDIMGRREFVDLVGDAYFEFANGILAVCDTTRRDTFVALEDWITDVRTMAGAIPLVILANKAEVVASRQVRDEELDALAAKHHARWFWTSAKTGENVEEGFLALAQAMVRTPLAT